MASNNRTDCRRIIILTAISAVFHSAAILVYLRLDPEIANPAVNQKSINVRLSAEASFEAPALDAQKENKPDVQPQKELPIKEAVKQANIEPDKLPNSFSTDDIEGSTNQANKEVGEVKQGERTKVKKNKRKEITNEVPKDIVATSSTELEHSIANSDHKREKLDDELIGIYSDFEEDDNENVDSSGEYEEGVESDIKIKADDLPTDQSINIVGNTTLLSDSQLSDTFVEDPFSNKESNELNIINEYLKAIWDAVIEGWDNPLSEGQIKQAPVVEIIFELNAEGAIRSPKVRMHSKFSQLDESLISRLEALRHHKFEMHESYLNKYRYFTLRWSGSRVAYELLPYENDNERN